MKKLVVAVSALVLALNSTKISAQEVDKTEKLDEIVITATKFPLKREHTGKVIYKISQKEIQNNAGKTVIELLNNIPGIEIKGSNSNQSEPRSMYVRGGRSRQVLVLIDGIPVSDASGINQAYDLRLLSLNQIESIEILKGASSTLYGSGAATGVINIVLKKTNKKAISGTYQASLGTNNTADSNSSTLSDKNQNASVYGNIGDFNFLGSFSLIGIDGMSSAKSKTTAVFENDGYYSKNGVLKFGYKISKKLSVETFLNYDNFTYDYDSGIYADNEINNGEQTQLRIGAKSKFVYNSGEVYLLASINKVKREDNNFSSFSNSINESIFKAESINLDLVNKISFSDDKIQLITGVNYQEHTNNTTTPFGNIDKNLANFTTVDPYATVVYISDFGLNLNLGGRLNNHSNYGNHFVYDANVSYSVLKNKEVSIKGLASYGTSFIAPSTYQLFSIYGDTTLTPETNATLEVGFESTYKNWLQFNAVYFNRIEENAIEFQNLNIAPWGVYANGANEINVSGLEADVTIKPIDKVKINIGYTFTDKDADVDYIPKSKLFVSTDFNLLKNTFVSLIYKNVGERKARFYDTATFSVVETTLSKYNVVDLNVNYKLLDGTVTFFGSITNLLNEDYEDILGYSTKGRNYKIGIRLQF